MEKSRTIMIIAGLVFVTALVLCIDFSRVDNIPYHEMVQESVFSAESFTDSPGGFDQVSKDALIITEGEGQKAFSAPVDFTRGDSLVFSFSAAKPQKEGMLLTLELVDDETGDVLNETSISLDKPKGTYSGELVYYEGRPGNKGTFRIRTDANTAVELSDLRFDQVKEKKEGSRAVIVAMVIAALVSLAGLVLFILAACHAVRARLAEGRKTQGLPSGQGDSTAGGQPFRKGFGGRAEKKLQDTAAAGCVILLVFGVLFVLYRQVDLREPLSYTGGDEMGIYYLVKTIANEGTTLVNPDVGGLYGGDMFDYPYSDKLSFLVVKALSLFSGNVYLITNLFYFLNFFLNGLAAFYVSRKLSFRKPTAVLIGVLFAFCPFIQMRYGHMWLTSFYTLPLACLLAVNIMRGRYLGMDGQPVAGFLVSSAAIAYLCAFTGLYYAYFTCALVAVAFVVSLVNNQEKLFRQLAAPLVFIGSVICGIIVNVLPNLLYWFLHGVNTQGQIAIRSGSDAEVYALKLIQLLLPRPNHRIWLFARLNAKYMAFYPLINENMTAAIGLIASAGFIISVLFLFSRRRIFEKGRDFACLNIGAFLIATIGGIGSIISLVVSIPMRCYNRMSIVIMFLSLLCLAVVLEEIGNRYRIIYLASLPILLLGGIYDQTVTAGPNVFENYQSASNLLSQVDEKMNDGDMIFELPVDTWPSPLIPGSYQHFMGYIETDGLRWSYGAMEGREEAAWQAFAAGLPTEDFLDRITYNGYDGVYLDAGLYRSAFGEEELDRKVAELTKLAGEEPMISEDGVLYFWDIRDYETVTENDRT